MCPPTARAGSANILDMRMNDLLKYLIALEASSGVLYPTYPMRRAGKYLTSVTGNFEKCLRTSSSENFGGSPRTNMREVSIAMLDRVLHAERM